MIFADGAGACILEAVEAEEEQGIMGIEVGTWTENEVFYLFMGKSNKEQSNSDTKYMKMHGRKIYEFALTHVPQAMKSCLDKANLDIHDVKKIFIHQANEKMDHEIIKRTFPFIQGARNPKGNYADEHSQSGQQFSSHHSYLT